MGMVQIFIRFSSRAPTCRHFPPGCHLQAKQAAEAAARAAAKAAKGDAGPALEDDSNEELDPNLYYQNR